MEPTTKHRRSKSKRRFIEDDDDEEEEEESPKRIDKSKKSDVEVRKVGKKEAVDPADQDAKKSKKRRHTKEEDDVIVTKTKKEKENVMAELKEEKEEYNGEEIDLKKSKRKQTKENDDAMKEEPKKSKRKNTKENDDAMKEEPKKPEKKRTEEYDDTAVTKEESKKPKRKHTKEYDDVAAVVQEESRKSKRKNTKENDDTVLTKEESKKTKRRNTKENNDTVVTKEESKKSKKKSAEERDDTAVTKEEPKKPKRFLYDDDDEVTVSEEYEEEKKKKHKAKSSKRGGFIVDDDYTSSEISSDVDAPPLPPRLQSKKPLDSDKYESEPGSEGSDNNNINTTISSASDDNEKDVFVPPPPTTEFKGTASRESSVPPPPPPDDDGTTSRGSSVPPPPPDDEDSASRESSVPPPPLSEDEDEDKDVPVPPLAHSNGADEKGSKDKGSLKVPFAEPAKRPPRPPPHNHQENRVPCGSPGTPGRRPPNLGAAPRPKVGLQGCVNALSAAGNTASIGMKIAVSRNIVGSHSPAKEILTSGSGGGGAADDEYGSYGFGSQGAAAPPSPLTMARPQIKTNLSGRIQVKASPGRPPAATHKKIPSSIPSTVAAPKPTGLSTSMSSLPQVPLATSGTQTPRNDGIAPPKVTKQQQQPLAQSMGKLETGKSAEEVYIPPPPPPVWEKYLFMEPISEDNYYTKDNKFYGAKMPRLLEWLSPSDELADSEKRMEMRYFALSYKVYLTPAKFFDLLVQKFKVPEGAVPPERIYIVQQNVLHFIWEWVKACFRADIYPDSTLYSRVSRFLKRIDKSDECDTSLKRTAKEVKLYLSDCKKAARDLLEGDLYIDKYADVIKPLKSRTDICSIGPEELVQQLIVIEQDLIRRISSSEFTKCAWSKKDCGETAPYVSRMASLFNTVSNWFVESVLLVDSSYDRSKLLKYITACAEAAFRLNDFNALLIFLSAAQSRCISRLKKSWKPKNKAIVDGFSDLMENNFKEIRRLQAEKSPYVPYLGLTLQDLTFIDQGNKDFVTAKPDIANWFKLRLVGTSIDKFLKCQNKYYEYAPNEKIIRIICSLKSIMSETESYERSLKIEPRDTIIV